MSRLCAPNLEYQFVNPTTQVALFSQCLPLCTAINNITWTVYQGVLNASSNIVRWTPFPGMKQYENIWFFGNSSILMLMICMFFFSSTGCRYQLQQLHCHQSVVPVQSHDRLLALRSSLLTPVGDELECPEFHHQSAAHEWLLFHRSTQWHHQHVFQDHLLPVARSRRHQGLFHLQ